MPDQPIEGEHSAESTKDQHTSPACPCTCHISPNNIVTRQTIIASHEGYSEPTLESKTYWDTDGSWELQTHRTWTCCHGFTYGFGTARGRERSCKIPCICSAHSKGLVSEHMSIHALLYATADYFDVPALKDLALEKFKDTAHVQSRSEDFAQAIRDVFTSARPEAKVTPSSIIIDTLVEIPSLWSYELVKKVLEDMGAVTLAVMQKQRELQAEKHDKGHIHRWQLARLGLGRKLVVRPERSGSSNGSLQSMSSGHPTLYQRMPSEHHPQRLRSVHQVTHQGTPPGHNYQG